MMQKVLSFCRRELIWGALGMNAVIVITAITLANTDMLLLAFMNIAILIVAMQINAKTRRLNEKKSKDE